MKNVVAYSLVVVGCILLLWASADIIMVERQMQEQPDIKRVAIGPPIAIIVGIMLILVGIFKFYRNRRVHT